MKQVVKMFLPALLSSLIFIGCKKSSEVPSTTTNTTDSPSANGVIGNWIVSSFTQKTEDKTSQVKGFTFTFSEGGKLTATQGADVESGTWTFSPSTIGYYGGTPTKASMSINFATAKSVKSLNRSWNIVSNDASKLSLISPEPAEDEHLIFSKK